MTDDDIARGRKLVGWAKPWHHFEAAPADPDRPSLGRLHEELGEKLSAALDEVSKLQADCRKWHALGREASEMLDWQTSEIGRLRDLHALAERAMHSANEASKGFEAQAQRYFDAKEPLEVVADAARAFVADPLDVDLFGALKRALDGAPIAPEVAKMLAAGKASE